MYFRKGLFSQKRGLKELSLYRQLYSSSLLERIQGLVGLKQGKQQIGAEARGGDAHRMVGRAVRMERSALAAIPNPNEAQVTNAHGDLTGRVPPFHNNVATWCSSSQGAVCIRTTLAMTCGDLPCPADAVGPKDLSSRTGKPLKWFHQKLLPFYYLNFSFPPWVGGHAFLGSIYAQASSSMSTNYVDAGIGPLLCST